MAAGRHDTMMNPPIEGLLAAADSKFRLVTLGAKAHIAMARGETAPAAAGTTV